MSDGRQARPPLAASAGEIRDFLLDLAEEARKPVPEEFKHSARYVWRLGFGKRVKRGKEVGSGGVLGLEPITSVSAQVATVEAYASMHIPWAVQNRRKGFKVHCNNSRYFAFGTFLHTNLGWHSVHYNSLFSLVYD